LASIVFWFAFNIEKWAEGRGRGEDYEDFGEAEGETGDTEE
jgi:hypothetical protein